MPPYSTCNTGTDHILLPMYIIYRALDNVITDVLRNNTGLVMPAYLLIDFHWTVLLALVPLSSACFDAVAVAMWYMPLEFD